MGKLDAYYYSFEPTGVAVIDDILEAVASAGTSAHNTEDWNMNLSGGKTPVTKIQDAANFAAKVILRKP